MMKERLVAPAIVEALERNGALDIEELFKSLLKLHSNLDRKTFEENLMALEIQGLVKVYSLSRDRRRIELVR